MAIDSLRVTSLIEEALKIKICAKVMREEIKVFEKMVLRKLLRGKETRIQLNAYGLYCKEEIMWHYYSLKGKANGKSVYSNIWHSLQEDTYSSEKYE